MTLKQGIERNFARALLSLPTIVHRVLAGAPVRVEGRTLAPSIQMMLNIRKRTGAPGFADGTIAQARKRFDADSTMLAPLPSSSLSIEALTIRGATGPLEARIYRPDYLAVPSPTLIFFHGGGFALGSLDSHDLPCQKIAAQTPCVVISVDYRLAPEHPYPACATDAVAAFRSIASRAESLGLNPAKLAVGGDSAGGNLAAVVAQETRSDTIKPCFQLLIYPVTDLTMSNPAIDTFAKGFLLDREAMNWFYQQYTPDRSRRAHPLASPLFGDVRGVAPACVCTAGFDPLGGEGRDYANRLRQAGVPVQEHLFEDLTHGFLNMCGSVRESKAAVDILIGTLRETIHQS